MQKDVCYWLESTFRKQADKVAYVDEYRSLTYKELHCEVLKLSSLIVKENFFKKPIAIYMDKTVDMIVAFLGVAFSGNYYSPIDINMPEKRIRKIIDIFNPCVVITKLNLKNKLINILDKSVQIICIDEIYGLDIDEKQKIKMIETRNRICDTDLLYVLFTSGSTGTPKGVCVSHRSVIDYIDWVSDTFDITENDSFGNQAPFYFDNSILDIYTTLKTGATMFIIPDNLFAWPMKLLQFIKGKNITTVFWVPTVLIMVARMRALKNVSLCTILKRVLFCGEVMPNKYLNQWRKYLPSAQYANLYGPTEITDVCTCYIVDREFADDEVLPIGYPIKNTDIIVLDENNQRVKKNEVGELCVRGTSLAMGYYNNLEKTQEVFVQNPLNKSYFELIYRTGDLVKYNDRGELVYLSRKDSQIQYMGHRVELGEIETALSSLEGIDRSCCLYDYINEKIIAVVEGSIDSDSILLKLKDIIPVYMIPRKIVFLEKMPINVNGKIDRAKIKEIIYE